MKWSSIPPQTKVCLLLTLGFVLTAAPSSRAHAQITYSAVDDFSATTNPGTVWSYLYGDSALSTTSLLTYPEMYAAGVNFWSDGLAVPDSIEVVSNSTGSPYPVLTIVFPTNELGMDPESGAAIVQFTAPAAGTYSIGGEFSGIDQDQNSHPVEILDNGRAIFTGTIALYGQSDLFSLTETLKAGDQIDFAVLTGSGGCSYCYLSTGLSATITSAVPEPDMAWLMLAGMGGLVGFARMGNRLRFAWIRRSTIGESRS